MIARRFPWNDGHWPQLAPLAARGVHAVLLHGQRGIGKTSLALDFAEALLCSSPLADGHRCGRCDECRLTEAHSHPDLRWVLPQALAERLLPQPETEEGEAAPAETGEGDGRLPKASREIRVDQVRALADFFGITSFRGGRRVVIVSPAEGMNAIAANALLKMLEEPPPRTMLVLVAHAPDEVLPTIRSRCVLLQVPVPERARCERWLAEQGVAEAAAALALASGAPLAAVAAAATGAAESAALYRLLEAGPALTPAQIVAAIGRDATLQATLRLLQCWAYDLVSCRMAQTVRYHPRRSVLITRIAAAARGERLWRWIGTLQGAASAREHPLNARLIIESLLLSYADIFDSRR